MGVEVHLGERLLKANEAGVYTDRGYIPGKLKVCAFGIDPNTELTLKSGIQTGRGILIDSNFRTSARGIYAIGDCAEYSGKIAGTARDAIRQARLLAEILRGSPKEYNPSLRSLIIELPGFSIGLIGLTNGEGQWVEGGTRIFYGMVNRSVPLSLTIHKKPQSSKKTIREELLTD